MNSKTEFNSAASDFHAHEESFRAAMAAAGLDYQGPIIADGALHRCKVNGDKALNSFYTLHVDGIAAGSFGCWKRGIKETWCSRSNESLTAEERAERDRRWKQAQAERDADRQRQHDAAAKAAQAILDAAQPAPADHPYLVKKQVSAYPGVLMGAWPQRQMNNCLLIPLRIADGRLVSVQAILPVKLADGRDKDILAKGEKKGAHFVMGDLHAAETILIAEGYATAATLHAATGYAAVMAIDSGNLKPVAEILKKLHPQKRFIIAADNDAKLDGTNPGLTKATAAAKSIKATLAVPDFAEDEIQSWRDAHDGKAPTDFNDLAALRGLDAIKAAATVEPPPAPTRPRPRPATSAVEANDLPPLLYIDDKGKKKLVSQQHAAAKLAATEEFAKIKYHPVHQAFYHYDESGGIFERKPTLVSESAVYRAIRKYSENFPFSAAYVSGTAKCLLWDSVCDFTPKPGVVGFKNGVLHLDDFSLHPHSPDYCLTSRLPFDWDVDAPEPQPVIDWLLEAVGGHADQVQLLRAWLNACVTGRPDLQRFLELVGHGGSGKGTFIRLATALLGTEAVHSTDLKSLEGNRFESAKIYGKKLTVITDAERYHGDVSMLKAITGQDLIRFEEKHKQAGESFTYGGMVMLAANQHTESTDYSSGIQRRRITVRFDHVVPAHERRDLDYEFEPWLSAVAKWALDMPAHEVTRYLRNTGGAVSSLRAVRLETLAATNPVLLDSMKKDGTVDQTTLKNAITIDGDPVSYTNEDSTRITTWLQDNWDKTIGN